MATTNPTFDARALPIFALRTVFFPGSILALRVFEPRYMDMCKECLRDGRPEIEWSLYFDKARAVVEKSLLR